MKLVLRNEVMIKAVRSVKLLEVGTKGPKTLSLVTNDPVQAKLKILADYARTAINTSGPIVGSIDSTKRIDPLMERSLTTSNIWLNQRMGVITKPSRATKEPKIW